MTKRVLITGAAGFTGRYMCEYLRNLGQGLNIIGTDIVEPEENVCSEFITADISCVKSVESVIGQIGPDYIIHLAGTFGSSDSQEIYRVNALSITALLEAVVKYVPDSVVIATGSAAEYGRVAQELLPVSEDCPCEPVTPYGLSKLLATQVALYYYRVHSLCTMIVRPFQLIGKGVTYRLAPGAFAEQLKQAIAEGAGIIKVGNLESSRDFLDVHDAVEAIWLLCQKPSPGQIFNLCSGRAVKIADMLEMMIKACGADVNVQVDPVRLRGKSDVSKIYGSYKKLNAHCGWQPERGLSESISEMFV